LVRLVGQAPITGTVYELEKLRCNLCLEVFTAEAPAGVGEEKYDATSASMMALLKYGSGMPFTAWKGCKRNWRFRCRLRRNGAS
jgi:transposase